MFPNRIEAATFLIPYLEKFRFEDVVVLAIPRGGVPMGRVIAQYFNWELNLLLTKKIGHPNNKEYAIGAAGLNCIILDEGHSDVPSFYIREESEKVRKLLWARFSKYMGHCNQIALKGKTLLLIDDGIATGYTIRASVMMLKQQHPAKIIVAVPVASPRTLLLLQNDVTEIIVLESPEDFRSVGQYYFDFSEVTDEEVTAMLHKAG